jgi:predicted RNase H-related nuclease YkuK (DUF458 family)
MKFRFYNGGPIPDIESYIMEYLRKHPDVEVYVGTDSAKAGKAKEEPLTIFVTTICFRHPGNGVHYVYSKERKPRIHDLFSKIWAEVERTNQVASIVKPLIGNKTLFLDLDINSLKQHGSHVAYAAANGFLVGQGYSVRSKPQAWAAHAADWLLK